MSFRYSPRYQERMTYSPNATKTFKFPKGNLFAGAMLDINLEIDIATATPLNTPDFQIARCIKELNIIRDSNDTIWKISGEALAALFQKRRGMEAPGNATLSNTVANNKKGRASLYLEFAPSDSLKPWDFLMDTRGHNYEMQIVFRDITAAGTLFGTLNGGTITAVNDENFIEIELDQVDLKVDPSGMPDGYTNTAPLMRGLQERNIDITQSNANGLKIDLPTYKTMRNVFLWSLHETNANQPQGNSGVLTDRIALKNTQDKTFQNRLSVMLRERTALRFQDANLPAGLYEVPITRWGAQGDTEVSDNTNELYLLAAVTKLTNNTYLRVISDTVERQ